MKMADVGMFMLQGQPTLKFPGFAVCAVQNVFNFVIMVCCAASLQRIFMVSLNERNLQSVLNLINQVECNVMLHAKYNPTLRLK